MVRRYCMQSFVCIILLFFLPVSGIPQARDKTLQISTAYFDIIYPPLSAESASLLAEHADGMADEVCALLGTTMTGRLPVYLEPAMEDLNAYFSPYPYNHIVLYDTIAADGSISVFRDGLLMVFYHELVHAVSMNIRTPFWQFVSALFGDVVSPATAFTMPLSFLEGATVSLESNTGEGRMNDPLSLHYLVQDKLENKFLSWKKSSGALDVFPAAKSAYLYGGAFSRWLQQTYGMDAYAEFWRNSGGFNPFRSHLEGRFRQTYQISLAEAWQHFADSITVPPVNPSTPPRAAGTRDGVISALASGPDGIVWLDANAHTVWFRSVSGKVVSLFDADSNLDRLSFSPDGRYLLVSGTVLDGSVQVQRLRVFDMSNRRFLNEFYPSVRDASFAGSSDLIVGIETVAQRSALVLFSRTGQKRNEQPEKIILARSGPGEVSYALYNPVWAGSGRIAYIAANGLDRSLMMLDIETLSVFTVDLPHSMSVIRYLQSTILDGTPVLSFSWAGPDSFYRYALYRPDTGMLVCQETDYSGAVFNPVPGIGEPVLYYKAAFSGRDSVRALNLSDSFSTQSVFIRPAAKNPDSSSKPFPVRIPDATLYNPLPWLLSGTFFPWASIQSDESLAPGFVYSTGDPADKIALTLEPSFIADPFFIDTRFSVQWMHRYFTFTGSLSDSVLSGFEPGFRYRSTRTSLGVSLSAALGPVWKSLAFSQVFSPRWIAANLDRYDSPYQAPYETSSVSSDTTVSFSARKSSRIPQFPVFPVTTTGFFSQANAYLLLAVPEKKVFPAVQGLIRFQTPFIPLDLRLSGAVADGLVFGITGAYPTLPTPLTLDAGIRRYLPSLPEYAHTSFAHATASSAAGIVAEIVPLTLEIQKELPVVPLYSNRIVLAGGYRALLLDTGSSRYSYADSLYVRGNVEGTLVYGALSTVVLSGSFTYAWPLREGKGDYFISLGTSIGF